MIAMIFTCCIVGAIWFTVAIHRLRVARGHALRFFRGAPPRFGGLDVLVLALVLGSLGLQAHPPRSDGFETCPVCGQPIGSGAGRSNDQPRFPYGAALTQGLAVSLMSLRALRWWREPRRLGITRGADVRRLGHLVGVGGQSGWTTWASPEPLLWRPGSPVTEHDYRGRASRDFGDADERTPEPLPPVPPTRRLWQGSGAVPTPRVGAGPGVLAAAVFVGLLAALLGESLLLATLGTTLAVSLFGRFTRPVSEDVSVVVLEHTAEGVDRWVPLGVSFGSTLLTLALDAHLVAAAGFVGAALLGLALTFLSDRISRAGLVTFERERTILTLHGTTLTLTGAVAQDGEVILLNPVGPVVVTSSLGGRAAELAAGLAAAVGAPPPVVEGVSSESAQTNDLGKDADGFEDRPSRH